MLVHRSIVRRLAIILAVLLSFSASRAGADESGEFSVVLLPDTQYYAEKYPETYRQQTQWIKDQAKARNIKFVIHLGDIVQTATDEKQWKAADEAHRTLDGAVSYSVLPGNHDLDDRDSTLYNKYFPPKRFEKHAWYGGNEDGTNDNNYCFFEAAGMKFLVLSLEYRPSDTTLAWADEVLRRYPDHRVIVATHEYRDTKKRRPSGNRIWDILIRKHPNVFLVVCGHVSGVGRATHRTDDGTAVEEILTDYQKLPNGGDGWLRVLRFLPSEDRIEVKAYSPKLDKTNNKPAHSYRLKYPMSKSVKKRAAA
ncbi:MAG: metallophosphoesterase [Pirellulales bacterium]|nr:metallophosphoesterase [Pirellulales bacterium]